MKTTLKLSIVSLLIVMSASAFALAPSYGFRSVPDNGQNPYERAAYGNTELRENPYQGIYDNRDGQKKDGNEEDNTDPDGRQNVRGRSGFKNGNTGLVTPDRYDDAPLTDALPVLALMALGYTFILIRRKK